jgi:hypothetical protein
MSPRLTCLIVVQVMNLSCARVVPSNASIKSTLQTSTARTPGMRMVDATGEPIDSTKPFLRALEVHPLIEGLEPGEVVVLRAQDGGGESWARIRSDGRGVVDLARAAPLEGTWRGADGSGWAWSMRPVPLRPRGATATVLTVEREGNPRLVLNVQRTDTPIDVETLAIREPDVLGDLVMPPGAGPFPAIILLGGSEGGNGTSLRRALDLSDAGFACLALSYFGGDEQEPSISRIPVERVERAAQWLRKQQRIDPDLLGIVGDSRGAELALVAGAQIRGVRAVAAIVPSGLRWGAMRNPNEAAWTYAGHPLPFVPWSGTMPETSRDESGHTTISTHALFVSSLAKATPNQIAAATIAVERIEGSVLLIAGKDDQIWPSCELAKVAFDRLVQMGHAERYGDVSRCFEEAGHRIGVPGGSTIDHARDSMGDVTITKGGSPQGAARAERETRALLRAQFERAFLKSASPAR